MSLLSINNLQAYYGDFQALFGINAELQQGECAAFVGANGAGKSTLMHCITGLVSKKTGNITFMDNEITHNSAFSIAKQGIALVPEGRKLFSSLSVKENLLIGAYTKCSGYWNLDTVYQLFPVLKEKKNMPIHSLSGGQQQMVAIARALMLNPKLLLCDELSLGLAPVVIKDIYNTLEKVLVQGTSVIIIEQDIAKALEFSNYIYCISKGRVTLRDNAESINLDDIKNAYFGIKEEAH